MVDDAPALDGELEVALVDIDRLLGEGHGARLDRDSEVGQLLGQRLTGGRPVGELGREHQLEGGILASRRLPGVAVLGPASLFEERGGGIGIGGRTG